MHASGRDPWRQRRDLPVATGAQLQETSLPDRLTVYEALRFFASLYPHRKHLVGMPEQLRLAGQERTRSASSPVARSSASSSCSPWFTTRRCFSSMSSRLDSIRSAGVQDAAPHLAAALRFRWE